MYSVDTAVKLSKKVASNETYPVSHYGPFFAPAKTKGTANVVVLGTNGDLVSVIRYIFKVLFCGLILNFYFKSNSNV